MPFYLQSKNYKVLASIFKIKAGDRHAIRWKEFVHTMDVLGFDCFNDVGRKRWFKPRGLEIKHKLRWNLPKKRKLEIYHQDE
ncbi:hypothetical protein TRAPUB_6787 [Trametes pubescens]|uniref:Uncharacterized protein n=1 Tax=Trametes pubescens TaxID=154538 RepID=A0A1M2V4Y1_TRAPU|nr:hypothetical protein TRAPUB_6787 [Trametes pubescens]